MQKTAFLYPGQGAQYVGMGRELARAYPVIEETLNKANDVLGYDLKGLLFEGPVEELQKTVNTQPSILALSIAYSRVLGELGVEPQVVAGLSLGEYSALVTAEALPFEEALGLVQRRGTYMQQAVPIGAGAMSAIIGLDSDSVTEICAIVSREQGVVSAANYNCPGQIVISGLKGAVQAAADLARQRGAKKVIPLAVSAPFHCRLLRPAGRKLGQDLITAGFKHAQIPVVSNVTAQPISAPSQIRRALITQVYSAVRWEDSIRWMLNEGVTRFIEVGPGTSLTGFMRRIDREIEVINFEDESRLRALTA